MASCIHTQLPSVTFPSVLPPMHSVSSFRIYYVAAFLLGAVFALLMAAPARADEPAARHPADHVAAPGPQMPDAYS